MKTQPITETTGLPVNTMRAVEKIAASTIKRWLRCPGVLLVVVMLCGSLNAQEPYYFHTIHTHGLTLAGGRTIKLNYMYQSSRSRQFKFSGNYIRDSYNLGRNEITTNVYNVNLQFQYVLLHFDKVFVNVSLGPGGYYLRAKDLLDIQYKEWRVNFVAGGQVEIYLIRNKIALTLDYDFFYTPWSRIYDFLHLPNAGLTLFLF